MDSINMILNGQERTFSIGNKIIFKRGDYSEKEVGEIVFIRPDGCISVQADSFPMPWKIRIGQIIDIVG